MTKATFILLTGLLAVTLAGCASTSQTPADQSTPATPAKSVSTQTKPADSPAQKSVSDALKQLFIAKYPEYTSTISIKIDKQTANNVRGMVTFEPGKEGGNFLAAQTGDHWQIVFEGNGVIPCSLSKYGFPAGMISDCVN